MTKTINFELSKRLDELGLLRDVETEYFYWYNLFGEGDIYELVSSLEYPLTKVDIKTLTTDEAIEFLPSYINDGILRIQKYSEVYEIGYYNWLFKEQIPQDGLFGKTLIESIENLITYLLDNNLIGPTKIN